MLVKNNYTSHLGFGTTRILPNETAPLPTGYSESHPLVKFYLSKGWLEVVNGNGQKAAPAANGNGKRAATANGRGKKGNAINVNVNTGNGGDAGAGNGAGGANTDKPLDQMDKEELQALAFERGVQFTETDTEPVLIEKIKAAQTGNE